MAALEKKWILQLYTAAKNGDVSDLLSDVSVKIRSAASVAARNALLIEIMANVSSLLNDKTIQLNNAVLDTLCKIVSQCCKATHSFEKDTQLNSFLSSVYHSVNAFLQKRMIKEVLELRKQIVLIRGKDSQLSEKNALLIQSMSVLYIKKIMDPLRITYGENCDDESYFSLINVLDDIVNLLMCGGIHNLRVTVNYSSWNSRLKAKHVTEKSYARFIDHMLGAIHLGEIFKNSSYEHVQNGPALCQEYIYAAFIVMFNSTDKDDFKRSKEALSKFDLLLTFAKPNCNLSNCIKFYKHFAAAFHGLLYEEIKPSDIEKNFEQSFDALASITQQPDIDETIFKVLFKICDNTSRLIRKLFAKIYDKPCEWWNLWLNIGVLSSINKLVLEMDNVIDGNGHLECKASDQTECPVKSSSKYDVSLMVVVSKLVKISLEHKMKDIHLLLPQAVIVQNTCLKHVESLKELGCVQWKSQWISTARVSYNLGYYCTKSDLKYHQNSFFADLVDTFVRVEDLACPALTCFSLWNCLSQLFDSYKLLRKLRSALITLVIAIAAVPTKKKEIFELWLTIKNDKLSNKLTDISLWKIYNKEKANLQSKYPLDFEKTIIENEIIILEMEAYRNTSRSDNPTSVEDSIKALEALNLDTSWRTRGIMALLKRSWSIDDVPDKAVLALAKATLENIPNLKEKDNRDYGFVLVELAFWVFLCQLKSDRSRMQGEMDRGKEQRIPTQLEDLLRNTADVVPAYCYLDVRNEMLLLESLATAVMISQSLIGAAEPAEFAEGSTISWDKLRNVVEVAARIYESFGYDHRAIACWGLVAKLAGLTGDKPTLLLALGHLLADLDHEPARSLLQQGDSLVKTLSTDTATKETQEVVVSYYLNKSTGCLNNGRFTEGKLALKKALALLGAWTNEETILHAKAKLITSQFQLLPASLVDASDLGDGSPHLSALLALATVKKMSRIRTIYTQESMIVSARHPFSIGHCSQIMKVFCSVTLWFAHLCIRQGFARQFEQTTPNLLLALQRQALALRTAQFLSALANMDLICETPDCQNITLLGKTVGCLRVARNAQKEVARTQPLLSRNAACVRNNLPETPIFQPIPFTAPEFMSHEDDCQCIYCKSPEIQTVAYDIICLQAWFYSLHGNSNQALEFFKGAMLIHKKLLQKQTTVFDGLTTTLSNDLDGSLQLSNQNGSWKCTLFRIKLKTDLSYIDFHARHNMVEKALEMNLSLAASLKKFPLVDGFMYPEVIHQQLCCASRSENKTAVAIGDLCVPYLTNAIRKSIGQVVAETPLGPTKILFTKTAKRPFSVFTDRYLGIHPKVLNLQTPQPSTKQVYKATKPQQNKAEILSNFFKKCSDDDCEDIVGPSPEIEVRPSTQKKIRPRTELTKKKLETIIKANEALKVPVENSAESVSPIMPEARKKLLFTVEERSTNEMRLKGQDRKLKKAIEKEPPDDIATSRRKPAPHPPDETKTTASIAALKSKKVESQLVRHTKKQPTEAQSYNMENCQLNGENANVLKPTKTRDNVDGIGATQDAQNTKIKDKDIPAQPTKSRLKLKNSAVPSAPTKSKKVPQPTDATNELGLKTVILDHQGPLKKVGRPRKVQVITEPSDSTDKSKKLLKVSGKNSESVAQITGMLQHTKLEEHDGENSKPLARQSRTAKPTLCKPKIKVSSSSASSVDSSKTNVKVENIFRSPLKAGLENNPNVSSPLATRRCRRALH